MKHAPDSPSASAFNVPNGSKVEPLAERERVRRAAIAAREALSPEEHRRLSARIETNLKQLLAHRTPSVIAFCWPYRGEFDARGVIAGLTAKGWRSCLPIVRTAQSPLGFRCWHPGSEMAVDRYGIHYPADGDDMTPEVLLLPFNAIDRQGYRLGYGAGYFDRTLASMPVRPYVVGVGFSLGLVDSVWPQQHDIPVDHIITENDT